MSRDVPDEFAELRGARLEHVPNDAGIDGKVVMHQDVPKPRHAAYAGDEVPGEDPCWPIALRRPSCGAPRAGATQMPVAVK